METWTISKTLDWTTQYFKKFNIEWPHLEAEILLAHALDLKRIQLYTNYERTLTTKELSGFKQLIQRRSKHEPIAYITGNQPFMSLDFYIDRSVLIPRPETEKLVEAVIDLVKSSYPSPLVADIGTGSGAIAVSLVKYLPNLKVIGIDSSAPAVKIAQKNAEFHKVAERCQFIIGDMLKPLDGNGGLKTSATFQNEPSKNVAAIFRSPYKFDIIISNPPYIPTADIDTLQTDVKDYEPREALDGGEDGLLYIKKLIQDSPKYLKTDGYLIFEFGIKQADNIMKLTKDNFEETKIIKDASGVERLYLGRKKSSRRN